MEPKFFAEFNALLADTPIDQIRTYLRWHLLHAYAGPVARELRPGNWNFYSHTLNGAERQQERWKRCTTRGMRSWARRWARCTSRAIFLRRKAAHPGNDAVH